MMNPCTPQVELVPYDDVQALALDPSKAKPSAFVAALLYFLHFKLPAIRQQDLGKEKA